jgi:hypothetical protein
MQVAPPLPSSALPACRAPALALLLSALALGALAPGCAHSSRVERARIASVGASLEQRVFPMPVLEARARLSELSRRLGLGVAPAPEEECEARPCPVLVGNPRLEELRVVLTPAPGGGTRVVVERAELPRGQVLLGLVWWVLGEEGLVEAVADARREGEAVALEEWRSFKPRWGFTGGAFVVGGQQHAGVGVRFGVRRWGEPHLAAGLLAEYERTDVRPQVQNSGRVPSHLLALPVRLELTPWTDFSERHGLPDASIYLLAGPSLMLPSGGWPESASLVFGLRTGVGVQLLHLTEGLLVPLTLEAQLQQHGLPLAGTPGVQDMRLLLGLGF